MGAWIEIREYYLKNYSITVAPYMGAWIEIICGYGARLAYIGRTLHGCVD